MLNTLCIFIALTAYAASAYCITHILSTTQSRHWFHPEFTWERVVVPWTIGQLCG